MSYTDPYTLILPLAIIPTLLHRASISSIVCDVITIEVFLLTLDILVMIFHNDFLASGSIPVLGSSRNTINGYPITAIHNDNFHLLPPENVCDLYYR